MASRLKTYFEQSVSQERRFPLTLQRVTEKSPLDDQLKITAYRDALDTHHDQIDPHLRSAPPSDRVHQSPEHRARMYFNQKQANDWIWLIVLDDVSIGYVYIEVYDTDVTLKEAMLAHVWIEPHWRSQGVLAHALTEAISILKKEYRLKTLFVNYLLSNPHAKRAYEKMGFKPWSETAILSV
jgi:RimJ/RimL family protein N-acetyltransferase